MTLLQHHLLALGITSVTTLGLGLFVFWKNPSRNIHRSMALYCFSLAWWSGWECAALQLPTAEAAFQLMRVEYLGVVFMPTLLCTAVSFLVNLSRLDRKRLLVPLYICSVAFLFPTAIYPTKDFLSMQGPVAYLPFWGLGGSRYWMFLVFFLGSTFIGHVIVLKRWYYATGQERVRLALFLIGSVAAYVGGCPEFALKYGIRLGWLNPFGLYGVPLYIGLLAYAIIQYQFLDNRIVVRKSLVYSLLVRFLTVGYFGLIYGIERLFQTTFGYQSTWLSLAAFALMALVFQPLKIGIQRMVDRLFFRAPHEELVKRMERLEREVREADKLKAISLLATGMAHEIKNPLASIKTFSEYLPRKYDDPSFREKFARIVTQELDKINVLVQQLLEFAKPRPLQRAPTRVSQLLDDTLALLDDQLVKRGIDVTRSYAPADHAAVDSNQMRQVFLNLLLNSLEAMERPGSITVETIATNGHLEAVITDTGPGIDRKDLPHVFDPFHTTKPFGTGLGLSVAHRIVRDHGGRISIDSEPGLGTTVRVRLPLYRTSDVRLQTPDRRQET